MTDEDKQWMQQTFATKEDLEKVETRLLTEFLKWASPTEKKIHASRAAIIALEAVYENHEDRIKTLEDDKRKGAA